MTEQPNGSVSGHERYAGDVTVGVESEVSFGPPPPLYAI